MLLDGEMCVMLSNQMGPTLLSLFGLTLSILSLLASLTRREWMHTAAKPGLNPLAPNLKRFLPPTTKSEERA